MALPTLFVAASMRDNCAFNFIETANPALSSAGEVIFDPEDRRASDWLKLVEDCIRSVDAFCACRFVLMTITTLSVSRPGRGILICATSVLRVFHSGAKHRLSPPALLAAGLQSCDNTLIGKNRPHLNLSSKIFAFLKPALRFGPERRTPIRLVFKPAFFGAQSRSPRSS